MVGSLSTAGRQMNMSNFETLLVDARAQLQATALNLTKNPHDADDLFQDTMLKAWEKFEQFQAGTNFGGWVNQIMRHTFISNLRKSKVRIHDIGVDIEDWQRDEINQVPSAEDQALADAEGPAFSALSELSAAYAQTVYMADVLKCTREEIATTLSIPIATVGSRLARGRKALRQEFGVTK